MFKHYEWCAGMHYAVAIWGALSEARSGTSVFTGYENSDPQAAQVSVARQMGQVGTRLVASEVFFKIK